ncbi:MAG TPA: Rrf2 family transcriptional regulator [Candidatus Polarisedimenticolia bacterium]|nr:Rrf2 family transcriptional regulator [Candidatus Polarisedimenticolia bacterium]
MVSLSKSARYALYAATEMAMAGPGDQVTVARVAQRYRIPGGALAKVFQRLVRHGIAVGTRGAAGGYRLARSPSQVTVLDVLSVFQPPRPPGQCLIADRSEPRCDDATGCRLRVLFDEVDELARNTFASVTLETLIGRRGGMRTASGG